MVEHRGFKTPSPGPLIPNGSVVLLGATALGSIVFGWQHWMAWLIVPPAIYLTYAVLEVARGSMWAKREMGLSWRNVIDTWMSGRPFSGYGGFLIINPIVNFVIFGLAWGASQLFQA